MELLSSQMSYVTKKLQLYTSMKTTLISIFTLASVSFLYGQDVKSANLSWAVAGLTDLKTANSSNTYSCTFKSMGSKNIVWEQKRGYTVNFVVTGTQGTWDDIKKTGQIVCYVTTDGESGTITFQKSGSATYVTLDLSQKSGNRIQHKYTVTQVSPLIQ